MWLTTCTFSTKRVLKHGTYCSELLLLDKRVMSLTSSDAVSQAQFKSIGLYFGEIRRPRQEKHK